MIHTEFLPFFFHFFLPGYIGFFLLFFRLRRDFFSSFVLASTGSLSSFFFPLGFLFLNLFFRLLFFFFFFHGWLTISSFAIRQWRLVSVFFPMSLSLTVGLRAVIQ